ncbi:MAG: hypothetical protein WDN25_13300 [Acetobacteraceae bacterium]
MKTKAAIAISEAGSVLSAAGVEWEQFSGIHWCVRSASGRTDYWPTTGKWMRGNHIHRGTPEAFLAFLKQHDGAAAGAGDPCRCGGRIFWWDHNRGCWKCNSCRPLMGRHLGVRFLTLPGFYQGDAGEAA